MVLLAGLTTGFAWSAPVRQDALECVDFSTAYPAGTDLGPNFAVGGFDFTSLGGSTLFVNEIDTGIIGMQFPDAGVIIKLAVPVSQVTLTLGSWGSPVNVDAHDTSGTIVDTATVTAPKVIQSVTLSGTDIVEIALTGGSGEAVLVSICPGGRTTSLCVGFEELSVGDHFVVGDTFIDSGVMMLVNEFEWGNGTMTPSGFAEVQNGGMAGGSGNELNINNANVSFTFPMSVAGLHLRFGEYGGNMNIRINGDFFNFGDLADINSAVSGGVMVAVFNGFGKTRGCSSSTAPFLILQSAGRSSLSTMCASLPATAAST